MLNVCILELYTYVAWLYRSSIYSYSYTYIRTTYTMYIVDLGSFFYAARLPFSYLVFGCVPLKLNQRRLFIYFFLFRFEFERRKKMLMQCVLLARLTN